MKANGSVLNHLSLAHYYAKVTLAHIMPSKRNPSLYLSIWDALKHIKEFLKKT